MDAGLAQLTQWIDAGLGTWAYLVIFSATALEASALLGLFVPAESVLLFAGFLAYRGTLGLGYVIAAGLVGSVVGDSIGYEVGRRFGPRLESSRLGRMFGATRWERARSALRRQGPQTVLVGRFVGLLRAVVPSAAGAARMPYRSFLIWNVTGATLWAPLVVIGGYAAGESYAAVARYLGPLSLVLVTIAILAFLIFRFRRRHDRPKLAPASPQGDRVSPSKLYET